MQLDRRVVSLARVRSSTNDSSFLGEPGLATADEPKLLEVETMQEHLGMGPVDSMAKALPLWKRFYKQWSKQLLQV
jgi:hypothetical protein